MISKQLDFGTPNNEKPKGGHCCRAFTLFWTFEDLAEAYNAAMRGETKFTRPATGEHLDLPDDIIIIGPMLRLVGVCDVNPLSGIDIGEPRKVWRCIYQREDCSCMIYDKRPAMCRRYPSDGECSFKDCQSTDCPGYRGNK